MYGALTVTTSTMALTTSTNQALLDAQLELWHNTFGFLKSMALKSALDLRIADAIHSNGGGATLPQGSRRGQAPPIQDSLLASPHARARRHRRPQRRS